MAGTFLDYNATDSLNALVREGHLWFKRPNGKRSAMPKLNFNQNAPANRDIGGLSGKTLLLIAIGTCLEWALLLHAQF